MSRVPGGSGARHATAVQFLRFCAVGASSVALSLAGVWFMVARLGLTYAVATAIVAILGNLYGFAANRSWTFDAAGRSVRRQLLRYVAVVGLVSGLSTGFVVALVELTGLHYLAANASAAGLFTITNFLMHRHWTFSPR